MVCDMNILYDDSPPNNPNIMSLFSPFMHRSNAFQLYEVFWHHRRLAFSRSPTFTCGNIEQAIARIESRYESVDMGGIGWATQFSMNYMFYLCGEECLVRWKSGMINLPEVEQQAEHNLRNSFAVVGLLNETEEFYEMISNRIQYMDTSLNKHVVGSKNSFSNRGIITECQVLYQDPAFQKQLLNLSDEIAALNRLFKVAVRVNRFQQEELKTCTSG